MFVPSLIVGGVQTFAVNLAIELSNFGEEVFLTSFQDDVSEKYREKLNKSHVVLNTLGKNKGFSFSFLKTLSEHIRSVDPDIINTHSSRTIRYLFLIKYIKKIPTVHTITNNPQIYNKKLFSFYKFNLKRKLPLQIVGISELVSKTFCEIYKYPPQNVRTIYNGIPIINNSPICSTDKRYTFFFCGSLIEIKRPLLLLESFAQLSNQKARLAIAGSGDLASEVEDSIKKYHMQDRVLLLGQINDPSIYYQESKFFILTSYSEGNPISILEAMSFGLPIIAPSVGGIPDLVNDGENGFLFDKDISSKTLSLLLEKVINMPDHEYLKIAKNNILKSKKWDIIYIAQQYLSLFQEKKYE